MGEQQIVKAQGTDNGSTRQWFVYVWENLFVPLMGTIYNMHFIASKKNIIYSQLLIFIAFVISWPKSNSNSV